MASPKKERIHKVIAASGLMSRREAERAIRDGRVKLNRQVVSKPGVQVDPSTDAIEVDHQLVEQPGQKTVVLLNKPRAVLTTLSDPHGRPTVMDLIPIELKELGVKPAGRLDFDSEGLLILTNQGDLIQKITHPKHRVKKVYDAKVNGAVKPEQLAKLKRGLRLEDGFGKFEEVSVVEIRETRNKTPKSILRIVVREGKNRFIRRMLDRVRLPVMRLRRVQIGPVEMKKLPTGSFKVLKPKEIRRMLAGL